MTPSTASPLDSRGSTVRRFFPASLFFGPARYGRFLCMYTPWTLRSISSTYSLPHSVKSFHPHDGRRSRTPSIAFQPPRPCAKGPYRTMADSCRWAVIDSAPMCRTVMPRESRAHIQTHHGLPAASALETATVDVLEGIVRRAFGHRSARQDAPQASGRGIVPEGLRRLAGQRLGLDFGQDFRGGA